MYLPDNIFLILLHLNGKLLKAFKVFDSYNPIPVVYKGFNIKQYNQCS